MNPEIFELFIPLVFLLIVGGLIGLRMLKPYGNRILDLIEEMNRSRQSMIEEERSLQQIHDRLDLLAERQDFLESLVESRLEGGQAPDELPGGEPSREREGGPSGGGPGEGTAG